MKQNGLEESATYDYSGNDGKNKINKINNRIQKIVEIEIHEYEALVLEKQANMIGCLDSDLQIMALQQLH